MKTTANKAYDLTEGSILKKLMVVAIPMMANQLMQMSYNLTDMFWLGRSGSDAVAASGTAGMFMWFGAGLMMLGRIGCEIGVSQSLGKDEKSAARSFAQNAIYIGGIVGLLYGIILSLFRTPLIGFFGIAEKNVVLDAEVYLLITALVIPLNNIASVIGGAFTGSGNSRTPFFMNAMGLAMNIVLDPLFIIKFGMGVKGAAIATILSQIVVFLLNAAAIKKSRNRPFEEFSFFVRPDLNRIKPMLRWALPVTLESVLFCFLSMQTSRFEASFGSYAIAVSRVGSQVESLTWLVGGGYASALISYVGQNYGAGRFKRISKGMNISFGLMTIWGAFATALLFFFGRALFAFFLPDPELLDYGAGYLRILALAQIPMCIEGVAGGGFKGTGKSIPPAIVSITVNALRVAAAYFFMQTALGLYGIWLAVSLSSVVKGIWGAGWYFVYRKKLGAQMSRREEAGSPEFEA